MIFIIGAYGEKKQPKPTKQQQTSSPRSEMAKIIKKFYAFF